MNNNNFDCNNYKKEIIDGKVFVKFPAASYHAIVISNLHVIIANYLREKNSECKVVSEGLAVYLNSDTNTYVLPDISVLCDKNKFSKRGYEGSPTFIAEVLSPATAEYDKTTKLKKYESSGVKEYWIINCTSKTIEQYVLTNDKYEFIGIVSLLEQQEIDNLPNENKTNYTKIIKSSVFEDLQIDLENIFD